MSVTVEETHDQFRIEIDDDELQRALDAYVQQLGIDATSALGIGPTEQAELFRDFVADVLSKMKLRPGRTDWPDQFWLAAVQRTSERSLGVEEVTVSLGAQRVYFWGCEIGRLVRVGRLAFAFGKVNERALPPEMRPADDDDDLEGRGC